MCIGGMTSYLKGILEYIHKEGVSIVHYFTFSFNYFTNLGGCLLSISDLHFT